MSESNFIVNDDFESDKQDEIPYDLSVEAFLGLTEQEILLVYIHINIFENSKEKNYPFEISLKVQGRFDTDDLVVDIDDTEQEKLCIQKGLQELYPYIKSYVLNLTSMGGFPPLTLPNLNYSNVVKKED
ncbi:protein-export chaperone SecB [Solibacillus sp. FSL R7-0668]|uniref:protein-export chaperone SecB n=1 Tax=Solibacillus sp. FSL R7-0668 TaxID=2921688 RepID=UPI0030F4DA8A